METSLVIALLLQNIKSQAMVGVKHIVQFKTSYFSRNKGDKKIPRDKLERGQPPIKFEKQGLMVPGLTGYSDGMGIDKMCFKTNTCT